MQHQANNPHLIKNAYHLCINKTKKSFHVTIYKLARIWSIVELTELYYCNTTEKSTINYATENAVC